MNLHEIKEKVAAGLRNMNLPPSALLYCDNTLGMPCKLAGIPIYIYQFMCTTHIQITMFLSFLFGNIPIIITLCGAKEYCSNQDFVVNKKCQK